MSGWLAVFVSVLVSVMLYVCTYVYVCQYVYVCMYDYMYVCLSLTVSVCPSVVGCKCWTESWTRKDLVISIPTPPHRPSPTLDAINQPVPHCWPLQRVRSKLVERVATAASLNTHPIHRRPTAKGGQVTTKEKAWIFIRR